MVKTNRYPGVTPLGDGRYRLRKRVHHPKSARVHDIDREVEAESAQAAAKILSSAADEWLRKRGASEAAAPRRLADALEAWLEEKRATVRPSTASTYSSAVAWWRRSVLGEYLLERIEPRDVRALLLGWLAGGGDHSTVDGRLRVLRTFAREERCAHLVEGVRLPAREVREDERVEDEGRGAERRLWRCGLRGQPVLPVRLAGLGLALPDAPHREGAGPRDPRCRRR